MATRKVKSPTTGETVDAEVVEIEDIKDPPIRISLADGTQLRLKTDVVEVLRFKEEWDNDGNPLYNVRSASFMAVLDAPDPLEEGRSRGTRQLVCPGVNWPYSSVDLTFQSRSSSRRW